VDRAQGLRRAAGATGLLAAFGVAGTLAVATAAYVSHNADESTTTTVDESTTTTVDDDGTSDTGSAWPQLSGDNPETGQSTDQSHVTSGGS
jgi:hypothetical protein